MGTLNEDLTEIKSVEDALTSNKVARFAYTENAYNNNDANGVDVYNVDKEQNIPNGTASIMKVNQTVINKGYRAQASSITRMLMNHFLGRLSYNVNKVNDNMSSLLSTLQSHLGTPNGIASLDASGRIPYSQLPESAMEYKGTWNASTNTPTLADGTGNTGDMYMVSVEGTVDFGSGDITLYEGDSVVYNGSVWQRVAGGKEAQHATNADTADKLTTPRKINGVSFDGSTDITVADSTKAPTAHASSATTYGVSSEDIYGHAKASTVAGSPNGTASKGTTPTVFAQSNHVHPLQTSVSGNAGTATKLATPRKINGVSFDGSTDITLRATDVGAVAKVNNKTPDSNSNVTLSATDVGAVAKVNNVQPTNGNVGLTGANIPVSGSDSTPLSAQLTKVYPYIYTGRNLVEVFGVSTAVQAFAKLKEKSDAGDFSGLGIGDYINIPSIVISGNTITYNSTYENLRAEIVAFDQYYRNGDTDITNHHIIMQMKNCPLTHRMNESNNITGGWASSGLTVYLRSVVAVSIEDAIGISLKTIRRMLSTHGSWSWFAEKCFLPSEVECIGTKAWSDNYGYTVGNCRQWAMFQLRPDRLIKFYNGARKEWWTCSDATSNSTDFVHVSGSGVTNTGTISSDFGVPFAFAI